MKQVIGRRPKIMRSPEPSQARDSSKSGLRGSIVHVAAYCLDSNYLKSAFMDPQLLSSVPILHS
jgi:hypothetical protein